MITGVRWIKRGCGLVLQMCIPTRGGLDESGAVHFSSNPADYEWVDVPTEEQKPQQIEREQLITKLHQLCKMRSDVKLPKGWESVPTNEMDIFYHDAMEAAGTSDPWAGWDAWLWNGRHESINYAVFRGKIFGNSPGENDWWESVYSNMNQISDQNRLVKRDGPERLAILSTIPPELVAAAKEVKS